VSKKAKYLLKLLGITGVVYLSFRYLLPLVILFILAYICARGMQPVLNWCRRKMHIPKKLMAPILLILFLVILFGFLGVLSVALAEQITDLVYSLPRYKNLWYDKMEAVCNYCDGIFGMVKGNSLKFMEDVLKQTSDMTLGRVVPAVAGIAGKALLVIFKTLMGVFIFFVTVLMFLSDRKKIRKAYKSFPLRRQVQPVLSELKRNGLIYVKAQTIITSMVSLICAGCLFLIHNKYYLLFGITIGVLDALPVLGSGLVFIPWAIFLIIGGNYLYAAILVTGYIATLLVREVLEPKLLGDSMGILPVFMLISIFVGINLFGVLGIVLGPIGYVTIKTLMQTKMTFFE
jgi:sporulation integral membrane protein YtvI